MTTARRRREWVTTRIAEVGGDAAQDSERLLPVADIEKGMTLVRMVIGFDIVPDGPSVSSLNSMNVSCGVGIVSEEAIASGALPDPNTSADNPLTGWLWLWRGIVFEDIRAGHPRIDMDIRSQRKLMYGSPLFIVDYNLNSGVDFSTELIGYIRCLYLLP